ncbi:MAG: hypothetical protein AB7E47_09955 [Desulfovibrionaceae bacterium]
MRIVSMPSEKTRAIPAILLFLALMLPSLAHARQAFDVSCNNVADMDVYRILNTHDYLQTDDCFVHILAIELTQDGGAMLRKAIDHAPFRKYAYDGREAAKRDMAVRANGTYVRSDDPVWDGYGDNGIILTIIDKERALQTARMICPDKAPTTVRIPGQAPSERMRRHWRARSGKPGQPDGPPLSHRFPPPLPQPIAEPAFPVSCGNVTGIRIAMHPAEKLETWTSSGYLYFVTLTLAPDAGVALETVKHAAPERALMRNGQTYHHRYVVLTAQGVALQPTPSALDSFNVGRVHLAAATWDGAFGMARQVCPGLVPDTLRVFGPYDMRIVRISATPGAASRPEQRPATPLP